MADSKKSKMTKEEKINEIYRKIRLWQKNDDGVLIGDILDYMEETRKTYIHTTFARTQQDNLSHLLSEWWSKRKDLVYQSDDCIDFVYFLLF